MSFLKYIFFGFLYLCMIAYTAMGQQTTQPNFCINPPAGFSKGGTFSLSPEYGCLGSANGSVSTSFSNPISPSGSTTNAEYLLNFKDGDAFTGFSAGPTLNVSTEGTYWIVQKVVEGGNSYISCKSFEAIKTAEPDFTLLSCGENTFGIVFNSNPTKQNTYNIVWGDNSGTHNIPNIKNVTSYPFEPQTHTYNNPIYSNPTVQATYLNNTYEVCPTSKKFTPVLAPAPKITLVESSTDGTSVNLTFSNLTTGKNYTIEKRQNANTWINLKTINPTSSIVTETISGLNVNSINCFRLAYAVTCGTISVATNSNEVCTIIPTATVKSTTDVNLDWNSSIDNIDNYTIQSSEYPTGANTSTNMASPRTITHYLFKNMECGKKYSFVITASSNDGVIVKSRMIVVDPLTTNTSTPAKEVVLVNVINNNQIKVSIPEPVKKEVKYFFYRSDDNGSNFKSLGESVNNFYDDNNVAANEKQYCYKVAYEDACGNKSAESAAFCSILLNAKSTTELKWTPLTTDPATVTHSIQYAVEVLDASNSVINVVTITTATNAKINTIIDEILNGTTSITDPKFRISAKDNISYTINGTTHNISPSVYSNIFTLPVQIYVPSAFTPDKDLLNINEKFEVKALFISKFAINIYDRWGNIIFESTNLTDSWDGTNTDRTTLAPIGTYIYKIICQNQSGAEIKKIGNVTLLR